MSTTAANAQRGTTFSLQSLRGLSLVLLSAGSYWLAAQMGFLFRVEPTNVAAVWPASGIAVAVLMLAPRGLFWPLLLSMSATNLIANLLVGQPLGFSVALMSGNAVEMLVIGALARWQGAPKQFADDVPTLLRVFFGPVVLGVLAGATVGATAASRTFGTPFWSDFAVWATADVLAILLLTPCIVYWSEAVRNRTVWPDRRQLGVLLAVLGSMLIWLFANAYFEPFRLHRPYVLFPLMFCCTLFCPPHLTMTLLVSLATLSIARLVGESPLVIGPPVFNMEMLLADTQTFTAVLTVAVLLSLALVRSKQRTEGLLRRSHANLERAIEQRTLQLRQSNDLLQNEIEARQHVAEKLLEQETQVRAELNELETIYRTASVGLCLIDKELRYVRVNEALAEIDGIPVEDHIGRSFYELFPTVPKFLVELFRRVIEEGEEIQDYAFDGPLKTAAGIHRKFLVNYYPVETARGRCAGCIVREVTDMVELEQELHQHRADLAHVARMNMLGGLAAGLAHELNQPLHAIANYAQGCLRRMAGTASGSELAQAVTAINHEAHRAAEIVRRLRDLVRKEPPRMEPVDLTATITHTLRLLGPEIKQHRTQVSVDVPDHLPLPQGDAIQLEQVLLNLVLNAIEATKMNAGAERQVVIKARVEAEEIRLAVVDNGPGVPPGQEDRVFTPFFSTRSGGLGFGLAISREIVERHGGRLTVEPNEPRGAKFTLALPLHHASEDSHAQRSSVRN